MDVAGGEHVFVADEGEFALEAGAEFGEFFGGAAAYGDDFCFDAARWCGGGAEEGEAGERDAAAVFEEMQGGVDWAPAGVGGGEDLGGLAGGVLADGVQKG